ncbi:hypothetical protein [Kiloniella sp. EL199]|uniref:hypothetical protein n=1 Tax=Kiloniella sp. EL199 TaxID=2107581 RepID=UPI000EA07A77|nr:hypothetical protein [Kiloniella sp. EL199]
MSIFSISLSDGAVVHYDEPCVLGTIKIDDFSESIYAPLAYWNVNDYRKQWREACQDLLSGCEKTALITSMKDSDNANFLVTWPMYRAENKVYIQNQILFLDEVSFDENNISNSISEREAEAEDGEPISEWSVSVEAIESFVG